MRFLTLPVKYYNEAWLRKAENHIGMTIKVDSTTLVASRGEFAKVCVEVDLNKPLLATYRMREIDYHLAYEGMHDIYFKCGKYGHGMSTVLRH